MHANRPTTPADAAGVDEANGIPWRPTPTAEAPASVQPSRLSTAEKLALFGRLFRGRSDVYPVRWESKTSGKSGYAPACANEWRPGVCEKPRIKCAECGNRELIPLSDAVLFKHLTGDHTIGAYPLLIDVEESKSGPFRDGKSDTAEIPRVTRPRQPLRDGRLGKQI